MPDIDRETAIKRLKATRDWLRDRYEGSNNVLFQRDTEALDFAIRELQKPKPMACYLDYDLFDNKAIYIRCTECEEFPPSGKKEDCLHWREVEVNT